MLLMYVRARSLYCTSANPMRHTSDKTSFFLKNFLDFARGLLCVVILVDVGGASEIRCRLVARTWVKFRIKIWSTNLKGRGYRRVEFRNLRMPAHCCRGPLVSGIQIARSIVSRALVVYIHFGANW